MKLAFQFIFQKSQNVVDFVKAKTEIANEN